MALNKYLRALGGALLAMSNPKSSVSHNPFLFVSVGWLNQMIHQGARTPLKENVAYSNLGFASIAPDRQGCLFVRKFQRLLDKIGYDEKG